MSITVTLTIDDGAAYKCKPPYPTAPFADVTGWTCKCGSSRVQGRDMHHDHDTHYATAHCAECGARVGRLAAKVDTIFGIDEDDRVLNGRPRVYR
jgi:hypothetical protein